MKKVEEMTAEELIKYLNSRKGWHGNQYRSVCGEWLERNKPKIYIYSSELEEEPKPCPKCRSLNIEVDADGMTTSLKGIDYQCIWVECGDCEFAHEINICDYPHEDRPTQLCIRQWNRIPAESGSETSKSPYCT